MKTKQSIKNDTSSTEVIFILIFISFIIYLILTSKGGECDEQCRLDRLEEAHYEKMYRGVP